VRSAAFVDIAVAETHRHVIDELRDLKALSFR
jgi:hypothetical protein